MRSRKSWVIISSNTIYALDIDHFKWINDNLGHSMGDKLLVKSATFLKNVRKYDVVVRLGGDEFAILFDDLSEKADAVKIAEKSSLI